MIEMKMAESAKSIATTEVAHNEHWVWIYNVCFSVFEFLKWFSLEHFSEILLSAILAV